jgi:hypothetical protein
MNDLDFVTLVRSAVVAFMLSKSWLLLADRQEIAENGFEASGQKLTADPRAAR